MTTIMTQPTTDERRLMNRTADVIVERGWTQERYVDPTTGAVCAMQALILATRDLGLGGRAYGSVVNRLHRIVGSALTVWNDEPGRTRIEVVRTLRQAAK